MSNNPKLFMKIVTPPTPQFVSIANGDTTAVSGRSFIRSIASFDTKRIPVEMKDTLFVLHLITNLLSVSKLRQADFAYVLTMITRGKGAVLPLAER